MVALRATIVGVLVLACVQGAWAGDAAPASTAETVAAAKRRLGEIVGLIGRGDASAAEAYVREAFASGPEAMSAKGAVDAFAELYDQTRGLDVARVETRGAGEATARVRNRLTEDWGGLRVVVEGAPPFRVVRFGRARVEAETAGGEKPAARLTDHEIAEEVGRYVGRLAEADSFSGVVLLARGGEPFFARAYGEAEKNWHVENALNTRFNIGSMTKIFTAVAVLQLVERGRVSLDDPLAKFVADVPDEGSARRITIRQLLTHTSGLGDHVNAMWRDPFRARYRSVDRMLELVRGVPPMFEPGAQWRYSNSGFLVLGKVIEQASGEDYYACVRRNVLAAAGMTDTDYVELDRVNERLAVGYQREVAGGRANWRNNRFDAFVRGGPEGGAYSTAADLLRFDRALRGHRLLRPEMTRLAMTAKSEAKSPGYGLGFEVEEGGRIVGHGGGFVGVQAKLDMYDAGDYTSVVLSNYGGRARPVVGKIRLLLLDATK